MRTACLIIGLIVFPHTLQCIIAQEGNANASQPPHSKLSYWAYDALALPDFSNIPHDTRPKQNKTEAGGGVSPIVIAIIDDAFRLSHKDIIDFVYTNPRERAANGIDDDGNGKADDISGWDISDNDNNVYPLHGREEQYFHGTMIAGSIVTVLRQTFGEDASRLFRILPVKVLSDHEEVPFLRDGYRGIAYAMEQGADIICCAWSGGEVTAEERKIVSDARRAGIALIGSAGNAYSEKVDNPAAMEGVLAVAGIDTLFKKTPESNYGAGVDLVAPAMNIRAAHPLADNAFFYGGGTSGAAGLVTGCVAVLKAVHPNATPGALYEALINTSEPIDKLNPSFSGKLGAGLPVPDKAVKYLAASPTDRGSYFNSERSRGMLYLKDKGDRNTFTIQPDGAVSGIRFAFPDDRNGRNTSFFAKQQLSYYVGDSLFYETTLDKSPPEVFIPGTKVKLVYSNNRLFGKSGTVLTYATVPIDSSTLFCSGTSHYTLPTGRIADGSGAQDYANNSSCMWQITVEKGKLIDFRFTEFDTEAGVDFVYLFDGELSIPENIIAKFSGPNIPPRVTSRSNSVLVWFVSDGRVSGKGWEMSYTTREAEDN